MLDRSSNKPSIAIPVYAKPPSYEDTLVLATCHQLNKRNPMDIWSRIEIVCITHQMLKKRLELEIIVVSHLPS